MSKILTISIAAYNVEGYIKKALDSLIDENIINDLEIFVVDDGGTDNTMQIAQNYANKYPKSIFCIHKENGGYGSTINLSVQLATGKYFKILDADDWFETRNLKEFLSVLRSSSADAVLTNSKKYFEESHQYKAGLDYNHLQEGEYNIEESCLDTRISMHTVTFKTSILKNQGKKLTEHSLYTDAEFIMYPLPYLNSVFIYHKVVYIYRIGRKEQSFSTKSIQRHYKEMERVYENCLEVYKGIYKSDVVKKGIALKILCTRMKDLFNFFLLLPISRQALNEIRGYQAFVEQECPEILDEVKKESKVIKIMIRTNCFIYPFASIWTKKKWGKQ